MGGLEIRVFDLARGSCCAAELNLVGLHFKGVRLIDSGFGYSCATVSAAGGGSGSGIDGRYVAIELCLGGGFHVALIGELTFLYGVRGGCFVLYGVGGKLVVGSVEVARSVAHGNVPELGI